MLQGQKPQVAMRLPKVPTKLWNKGVIHLFTVSWDSVPMQLSDSQHKDGRLC
jgi:hypothetical protein